MHEQLSPTKILEDEVELATSLESIDEVHDERVFDCLQDIPLCLGMRSVLLVAYYGGLLEHFHGKDMSRVLSSQLPHLEDFAVTTPAQNPPQLKVLWASLFGTRIDSIFRQLQCLNIWGALQHKKC